MMMNEHRSPVAQPSNVPVALDEETATRMAELFRTLGDASRIRILAMMAGGPTHVGALAEAADISESAVSHHLRHLRQMRLVRAHKEGRYVYYELDDDHVSDLFRCGLEHIRHG